MTTVCSVPGCPNLQPCPTHARTWAPGFNGWAWRRLAIRILKRDHHRCTCGARATTVHHVTPLANGGTDTPANLRSVCDACHARAHGWT